MLVIGSRAIVRHFPDFRPPKDWDLIGTSADIERLEGVLERVDEKPRPDKAHFRYDGVGVEVANADAVPYWARVLDAFRNEPVLDEPVLGRLHIAPASFTLITKQCGLIYRIVHWHKNLDDLYFLRDRIPTIPAEIAALVPEAAADARRMFARSHLVRPTNAGPCHPEVARPLDPSLHEALHLRFSLGSGLGRRDAGWQGFLHVEPRERRELMIRFFAEEALVVAAEHVLSGAAVESEATAVRFALRELMTGGLPEPWRYFGVNHYREIRDQIPEGWLPSLGNLAEERAANQRRCALTDSMCRPSARSAVESCSPFVSIN
jgi:hypothetical protein